MRSWIKLTYVHRILCIRFSKEIHFVMVFCHGVTCVSIINTLTTTRILYVRLSQEFLSFRKEITGAQYFCFILFYRITYDPFCTFGIFGTT